MVINNYNDATMTSSSTDSKPDWILSGSELSPFHLKIAAILRFKKIAYRDFPSQGSTFENLKIQIRIKLIKMGRLKLTYPELTDQDEFPLVPFLFGPNGENLYDSSAIARWLDVNIEDSSHKRNQHIGSQHKITNPNNDDKLYFLIQLIDEYFDEFGLYMVHHSRWKTAAKDNTAGRRLANEMPMISAPFRSFIANFFSARQVRRLPYLFSNAPQAFHIDGLRSDRQPPNHQNSPATHDLLEQSYINILKALEGIFSQRPYLFGNYFTLADASLYGQLGMNLSDPSAAQWIEEQAPNVFTWLSHIHQGEFSRPSRTAEFMIDDVLRPLIAEISRIYYPLMQQNEVAYLKHKNAGETQFNEAAFWQGKSLYQGILDGQPFSNVAKSFQVKTWQYVKHSWQALTAAEQEELQQLFENISPLA
jgi:glutathione S-transferase